MSTKFILQWARGPGQFCKMQPPEAIQSARSQFPVPQRKIRRCYAQSEEQQSLDTVILQGRRRQNYVLVLLRHAEVQHASAVDWQAMHEKYGALLPGSPIIFCNNLICSQCRLKSWQALHGQGVRLWSLSINSNSCRDKDLSHNGLPDIGIIQFFKEHKGAGPPQALMQVFLFFQITPLHRSRKVLTWRFDRAKWITCRIQVEAMAYGHKWLWSPQGKCDSMICSLCRPHSKCLLHSFPLDLKVTLIAWLICLKYLHHVSYNDHIRYRRLQGFNLFGFRPNLRCQPACQFLDSLAYTRIAGMIIPLL